MAPPQQEFLGLQIICVSYRGVSDRPVCTAARAAAGAGSVSVLGAGADTQGIVTFGGSAWMILMVP